MTDIRIKENFSLEAVTMDWLLQGGVLDEREELATSARVALGTDALAGPDEVLPDPDSTDRAGWWGDYQATEIWDGWPIGVKNWLLKRAKILQSPSWEGSTLERARNYTRQALQPFVDRNIASAISVTAERIDLYEIVVTAIIYRGPKEEIILRYQYLWETPVVQEAQNPLPQG
jgi:phage gp46-like protein